MINWKKVVEYFIYKRNSIFLTDGHQLVKLTSFIKKIVLEDRVILSAQGNILSCTSNDNWSWVSSSFELATFHEASNTWKSYNSPRNIPSRYKLQNGLALDRANIAYNNSLPALKRILSCPGEEELSWFQTVWNFSNCITYKAHTETLHAKRKSTDIHCFDDTNVNNLRMVTFIQR